MEGDINLGTCGLKLIPDKAPAPLPFNDLTCNLYGGYLSDPNLALGGLKYSLCLF